MPKVRLSATLLSAWLAEKGAREAAIRWQMAPPRLVSRSGARMRIKRLERGEAIEQEAAEEVLRGLGVPEAAWPQWQEQPGFGDVIREVTEHAAAFRGIYYQPSGRLSAIKTRMSQAEVALDKVFRAIIAAPADVTLVPTAARLAAAELAAGLGNAEWCFDQRTSSDRVNRLVTRGLAILDELGGTDATAAKIRAGLLTTHASAGSAAWTDWATALGVNDHDASVGPVAEAIRVLNRYGLPREAALLSGRLAELAVMADDQRRAEYRLGELRHAADEGNPRWRVSLLRAESLFHIRIGDRRRGVERLREAVPVCRAAYPESELYREWATLMLLSQDEQVGLEDRTRALRALRDAGVMHANGFSVPSLIARFAKDIANLE